MTPDDPAGDGGRRAPASDADLARRLDRLSQSLNAERAERTQAARPTRTAGTNYALAFRLASEFVAGIIVGAGLGWGFDKLAGSAPWGMIVFLMLGFAAGVANVLRTAGKMTTNAGRSDGPVNGGGEPRS